MTIFRRFELLFFIAWKGVFFDLEYHKTHFPGHLAKKKKIRKMAIFGPKPWVNPVGKMLIFRLFERRVFIA